MSKFNKIKEYFNEADSKGGISFKIFGVILAFIILIGTMIQVIGTNNSDTRLIITGLILWLGIPLALTIGYAVYNKIVYSIIKNCAEPEYLELQVIACKIHSQIRIRNNISITYKITLESDDGIIRSIALSKDKEYHEGTRQKVKVIPGKYRYCIIANEK